MEISDDRAFFFAMNLTCGSVLPMALKTALQLNLLDLIKNAAGGSVSASDLAAQLPTANPAAGEMIDRILRLLAAHGVVLCRVFESPRGGIERRYSPAPAAKLLTKNEEGISLAPLFMLIQSDSSFDLWPHLKDAILEGGGATDRAYGTNAYRHLETEERLSKLFNRAMFEQSVIFMSKFLETYTGFEGLKTLVDVGGGIGITLKMIIDKYPSIHGINLDLPHVIKEAPSFPGIENVAGDMFLSIPKADAVFMKSICHNWSDEHCEKLLRNCYEALDDDGKVIVVDSVMPNEPNEDVEFRCMAAMDVVMMNVFGGGVERTETEFNAIFEYAGFKKFNRVCNINCLSIIELYK